jgi:hypothetical protein
VGWASPRRQCHICWLATQPRIGIGQHLVVQDAEEWLVFEAFVECMLVLSLRPEQSMILDTAGSVRAPRPMRSSAGFSMQ